MDHKEFAKEVRRRAVEAYRAKVIRRYRFKLLAVVSGLEAKADLIRKGKGKNGRSMSPELLARHGIA